jgi:hypothetical protein
MMVFTHFAFLEQIAFPGHQDNMKIPYTSCVSSAASEIFLSLAILMKTYEGKGTFLCFPIR